MKSSDKSKKKKAISIEDIQLITPEDENKRRIGKLIRVLSTSGLETLDQRLYEELKCLCLTSEENIIIVYEILFKNLHKDHAEIRLSSFQICDQLLQCSKQFRRLLINDLVEIFELVLETNKLGKPLPPPIAKAKILKQTALYAIKQWNLTYGNKPKYMRLKLGVRFLSEKGYDFDTITYHNTFSKSSTSVSTPRASSSRGEASNIYLNEKLRKLNEQIDEKEDDILSVIKSLESCMNLLLPTPDEFFIEDEKVVDSSDSKYSNLASCSKSDKHLSSSRKYNCNSLSRSQENKSHSTSSKHHKSNTSSSSKDKTSGSSNSSREHKSDSSSSSKDHTPTSSRSSKDHKSSSKVHTSDSPNRLKDKTSSSSSSSKEHKSSSSSKLKDHKSSSSRDHKSSSSTLKEHTSSSSKTSKEYSSSSNRDKSSSSTRLKDHNSSSTSTLKTKKSSSSSSKDHKSSSLSSPKEHKSGSSNRDKTTNSSKERSSREYNSKSPSSSKEHKSSTSHSSKEHNSKSSSSSKEFKSNASHSSKEHKSSSSHNSKEHKSSSKEHESSFSHCLKEHKSKSLINSKEENSISSSSSQEHNSKPNEQHSSSSNSKALKPDEIDSIEDLPEEANPKEVNNRTKSTTLCDSTTGDDFNPVVDVKNLNEDQSGGGGSGEEKTDDTKEEEVEPDDEEEDEEMDEDNEEEGKEKNDECLREMGVLFNTNISISITLPGNKIEIIENEDNTVVIENAQGSYSIMKNKYLPLIEEWIKTYFKSKQLKEYENRSKILINLKNNIINLINKYEKINIKKQTKINQSTSKENNPEEAVDEDEEDDEDMIEVEEEIDEAEMLSVLNDKEHDNIKIIHKDNEKKINDKQCEKKTNNVKKKEEKDDWSIRVNEMEKHDPTSGHHHKSLIGKRSPSTSTSTTPTKSNDCSTIYSAFSERKKKLLEIAPKLPFDNDLYHWEDEKLPVPKLMPSTIDTHSFWCASNMDGSDGLPVPGGSSLLRTRVIEFTGKQEKIERSCNVLLSNGKLCPRRDKVKCPFHGIIFARDEQGNCINPEDQAKWMKIEEERKKNEVPDWQDPQLLREIKAQTGVDLTMPKKGERKRKYPGPGLTKLNKSGETPVERIKKKIFKPSVLRRVANTLDKLDQKKYRDKFGDQFNYN